MSEFPIEGVTGPDTVRMSRVEHAPRPDRVRTEQPAEQPAEQSAARPEPRDRVELDSGTTGSQVYAQFSVQPDTGAMSIKIVDAQTEEVIREIPPDKVLRIAQELQALARRGNPGRGGVGLAPR